MPALSEMHIFKPNPQKPRQLRDAFAKFATGVTIVTCAGADGPVCITANSFASISLVPPLVMWAAERAAGRFATFDAACHYAIHVLGAEQADWARRAARDGHALRTLPHRHGTNGVPLLDKVLARFECQRYGHYDAGDHRIILGEVLHAAMRDGTPLAYYASAYGRIERV